MSVENAKRKVISSTKKNGKIVAQQVIYTEKSYSITKHEKIHEDDFGNIRILRKKGIK